MNRSALSAVVGMCALTFVLSVKGEGKFRVPAPAPSGKQRLYFLVTVMLVSAPMRYPRTKFDVSGLMGFMHNVGMPWKVAHARSALIDSQRKDPYDGSEDRKVAYSVFMPVEESTCTATTNDEYAPSRTAKSCNLQFFGDENAGVFDELYFESCSSASGETPADHFPLLVLEPAVQTSRFLYNQLARQLSANGAYVVTIDHPYDAPIVEFPGSDAIESNETIKLDAFSVNRPVDDAEIKKAIDTRINDVRAVVKELEDTDTLRELFPGIKFVRDTKIDTKRLFLLGHGLGGSVASTMSASDRRVEWIINLSGSTPVLTRDIFAYTIFFGRDDYTSEDDEAWQQTKKHLAGPQVEWTYSKAEQFDYSDLPLVSQLAGRNKDAKGIGNPYDGINPGDPTTTFSALSCFIEAYFRDTVLPSWFPPSNGRLPGETHDTLPKCDGWFGGSMKTHISKPI